MEKITVGFGFTMIETVMGIPGHPLEIGVTVYTTVNGAIVLLINN